MRAVLFPDFSEGNPYQRELKAHLEARGVSVGLSGDHGSSHWTRRVAPLLGAVMDSRSPDLVHLHWIHPFFKQDRRVRAVLGGLRLVVELVVLRLLGVSVVWTIHNLFDHDRRLPKWFEVAVRHATVRLCDRAIVHCDQAASHVVRTYRLPARAKQKIVTVPHGHYVDSYPNEVGQDQARSEFGLADDVTVFLFFGRIRAYKNVPGLISAFKRLERSDVRLLVVGNPHSESLAAEVAGRCEDDDRIQAVLEFVPDTEVQCYMNAADVVVLPFDDILSSGSAMLAMSFGRPVIAPALGCVAALVSDGLAYDPSDPDALLSALEQAITQDSVAIGQQNERRARAFDWGTIATETEAVYRAAVA